MAHRHRAALLSGKQMRGVDGVADLAAHEVESPGEKPDIDIGGTALGQKSLPDRAPVCGIGPAEFGADSDPSKECLVEIASEIGGQDRQAVETFQPLQEKIDGDVGITVVAVLDLGALAEERVGLVEEQRNAARARPRRRPGRGSSRFRRYTCRSPG